MASSHTRNIGPMQAAPRCGAKKRNGESCCAPAISGKKRCRIHGGRSPGAPLGNTHALKHGIYSAASLEEDRLARQIMGHAETLLARLADRTEGGHEHEQGPKPASPAVVDTNKEAEMDNLEKPLEVIVDGAPVDVRFFDAEMVRLLRTASQGEPLEINHGPGDPKCDDPIEAVERLRPSFEEFAELVSPSEMRSKQHCKRGLPSRRRRGRRFLGARGEKPYKIR